MDLVVNWEKAGFDLYIEVDELAENETDADLKTLLDVLDFLSIVKIFAKHPGRIQVSNVDFDTTRQQIDKENAKTDPVSNVGQTKDPQDSYNLQAYLHRKPAAAAAEAAAGLYLIHLVLYQLHVDLRISPRSGAGVPAESFGLALGVPLHNVEIVPRRPDN